MKKPFLYFIFFLFAFSASGQYYLRGEIKGQKNTGIQNVKIFIHSAKANYYTGSNGSFGITINKLYDSITLTMEGYEIQTLKVKTDVWQTITLKLAADGISKNKPKLISISRNEIKSAKFNWYSQDETYFQLVENDYVNTAKYPNTGFSLNVNKASYSNIRRFLNMKSTVPPDAVRVEELVNYFNLHYRTPEKKEVFRIESQLTDCPWNAKEQLLFLNVSAKKLELDKIPPSNFVFLIDVSGSMDMPNRLPLLQAAFQLFVKNLRAIDTVSIVTYGGTVGIWLQPTSGVEKEKICKSIEQLTAAGDTPGESAIRTAYKLASRTFIKGGNNRVILATDGDFNVGESTEKALEELIIKQRQTGVYLTCLGVGMGNLKDSKLQTLAKKGNGNYAYIDDIREAEKILVKELTQTFYAVADNVFMDIRFNPSFVKQYRLIGFDNKKEALTDTTSDLEGGEVGSGNSTLAIFQIVPADPNNYNTKEKMARVCLRYRVCNDTSQLELGYTVNANYLPIDSVSKELKFAAAVSLFALRLRQSAYLDYGDWDLIANLASASADESYLQQEFIQLIEKARKLYPIKKKKKKNTESSN
ncbi:MAG: von Willebrand factor type A domain-containing protein [Ferruginibacter sp.]